MDKDMFQKQENELRDILNEWDPLGVIGAQDDGGPFDEYDDPYYWVGADCYSIVSYIWNY